MAWHLSTPKSLQPQLQQPPDIERNHVVIETSLPNLMLADELQRGRDLALARDAERTVCAKQVLTNQRSLTSHTGAYCSTLTPLARNWLT
jgi:hypothetical protein